MLNFLNRRFSTLGRLYRIFGIAVAIVMWLSRRSRSSAQAGARSSRAETTL